MTLATVPVRAGTVLVIGIGNLLLRDEGVGVHVVRSLEAAGRGTPGGLPANVHLVDGGTLGLDLLPLLHGAEAVVFVDATDLGAAPGTVAVLRDNAVAAATAGRLSVHDVGLADLLAAARLLGWTPPRISLVAIQPAAVEPGLDLSAACAAALPDAVEATRAEVRRSAGGAVPDAPGAAVPDAPGAAVPDGPGAGA